MDSATGPHKPKVWDLPIRLLHGALILLFAASWYTAENMHVYSFGPQDGPSMFDLHTWCGYSFLFLLCFRAGWGVWGSETARFANFIQGPKAVWRYLTTLGNRHGQPYAGHNPTGGWSVLSMYILLLAQALTGLFASEDTFGLEGPLHHLVAQEVSYSLATLHKQMFIALQVLVGLHVVAIVYYEAYRNDRLVLPMITGTKVTDRPRPYIAPIERAIVLLLVLTGAAAAIYFFF